MRNNDFKLKFIFPCRFEPNNPDSYSPLHYLHLPYGMGILTTFLRQHNYYVEQEDLSVRFNRYAFLSSIFKNNMDLDILKNKNEMRRFFETGSTKGKLGLYIDKILDSISIEGFDLIGFSIFSYFHFLFAIMLSKKIKQRTNTPIVFGGQFIGLYGYLFPKTFNFIDYMIVGDGRIPLLKLIDYLKKRITISEVPNLIYRDDGKLITAPVEYYPLEDMPVPDFDGLPLGLYKEFRCDLPPKKWTQRRVGGSINTGS